MRLQRRVISTSVALEELRDREVARDLQPPPGPHALPPGTTLILSSIRIKKTPYWDAVAGELEKVYEVALLRRRDEGRAR